jgi:hypothetical protein
MSQADQDAAALSILATEPFITYSELGRRLSVDRKTAKRIKDRVDPVTASGHD